MDRGLAGAASFLVAVLAAVGAAVTVRWTHYRVFVVAVVFATLGFIAGTAWTVYTMKPSIEALAAAVEQCLGTWHQPAEGKPCAGTSLSPR